NDPPATIRSAPSVHQGESRPVHATILPSLSMKAMEGTTHPMPRAARYHPPAPTQIGEADPIPGHEFRNLAPGLSFIERCADEGDASSAVFLFSPNQHGHFFRARSAPGDPGIQHYYASAIIPQANTLAIQIAEGQFGRTAGRRTAH